MKDREWCKRIEDEITGLNERLKKLEGGSGCQCRDRNHKIIELSIEWPEADIGGLHFNMQKTSGVFELKEDGNYYSRDILSISARDTDEGTGRDLLSEYLDSEAVREAFYSALTDFDIGAFSSNEVHDSLKVFLPEKNQGVKKYNGVTWVYWLRSRYSGSSNYFCAVYTGGSANTTSASNAYGFAPVFCVAQRHG
jgi:hypothetical protein